jgi:hypothetical protein
LHFIQFVFYVFYYKKISNCEQHYSTDQPGTTYFLQRSYHTDIKTTNLEEFPQDVKKKVILHALSAYSAILQRRKHIPVHTVKARGGVDVLLHAFLNLGIRLI